MIRNLSLWLNGRSAWRLGLAAAVIGFLAIGAVGAQADYTVGLQAFNDGDYKTAMKEWDSPAQSGDAQAQHGLGLIYETGRGLEKPDLQQAIRWYRASADQNYAPALNNLAMLYASGRGVPKDQAKAVQLWKQAADAGNTTAEFNLGIQYMVGSGLAPSDGEGARWIGKAAEGGLPYAQLTMGQLYREGRGVPKDAKAARDWFERASANGNPEAKQLLQQIDDPASGSATPVSTPQLDAAANQSDVKKSEPAPVEPTKAEPTQPAPSEMPKPEITKTEPLATADSTVVQTGSSSESISVPPPPARDPSDAAKPEVPKEAAPAADATKADTGKSETASSEQPKTESKTTAMAQNSPPENETKIAERDSGQPKTAETTEAPTDTKSADESSLEAGLPKAESLTANQKVIHIWLGDKGQDEAARKAFDGDGGFKQMFDPLLNEFALEVRQFVGATTIYRIYVGPIQNLQKAQELCEKIKKIYSGQMCRPVIN